MSANIKLKTPSNGSVTIAAEDTASDVVVTIPATNGELVTSSASGNVVISDNSTNAALRITQVGSGNALLVEDSANPDASPFVIDNSGRVIVGSQTPITARGNVQSFQVVGVVYAQSSVSISRFNSGSAGSGGLEFNRSRSGTLGVNTVVNNNDNIAEIYFNGADGTSFIPAASITANVDGTPGTNDMPGRLVFSTTANGASSPTERMRIDNAGQVGIGGASQTAQRLYLAGTLAGASTAYGMLISPTFSSDATANVFGARTNLTLPSAASSLVSLFHYSARLASIGTTTVTNQYGFIAESSLTGATNNYGFHSNIPSGTGRWNFYAAGTAANYFAGNVLLNTTTPTGGERMALWYSSNTGPGLNIRDTNAQNGNTFIQFNNGATIGGAITSNGTTTMTYGSASDYRLKDELVPMLGALDKVLLLQPKTGVWKDGGADFSGFVAHELQEVFPDCVVGEKDAVHEDGSPKYQMVDTGSASLIATLTAAIQEQQVIIKQLQADVAALKGAA
jgi:hypothetical protein